MDDAESVRDGRGDFDFFVGTWDVANRRLRAPLTGSDEWDEFPATSVCRGVLFDGGANLDEITFPTRGFSGLTLRLYDPARREWSLSWVNSRIGLLQPPVLGRFADDGIGEFVGDEIIDGVRVRCRFVWSGTATSAPRWEQAFSRDEGQTWETNWIMQFSRAST